MSRTMDIIPCFMVEKNLHRFVISGVQEQDELLSMRRKIESLDGRVEDLTRNIFTPVCTHVIAKEFSSTEKVLGALAGGKWLLSPQYIRDSFQRGHWLSETNYELKNHGNVARYCRQSKEKRGYGIYSGWTIYIKLENENMTRSFRRVVAAGGAEIASLTEISKVDMVISDRKMLTSVRSLVGRFTPIVDISYVKNTLILKGNPSYLRYYLLDAPRKEKIFRKHDSKYAQGPEKINGGWSQQKRPLTEVPIITNKNLCSQSENLSTPSYQKARMDDFIKVSPRKVLAVSSTFCQASPKKLKRKYQRIPFSPEKYSSISKYFAKEPKPYMRGKSPLIESLHGIKTEGVKRGQEQNKKQLGNMCMPRANDEVEIVKEISRTSSAKTKESGIEILESDSDDCMITRVVRNFENDLGKIFSSQIEFNEQDCDPFKKEVQKHTKKNKTAKLKSTNRQCCTVDTKEDLVSESVNFYHGSVSVAGMDSRTTVTYKSNLRKGKDFRTADISRSHLREEKDSRTTEISHSNLEEGKDSRTTDISHSNLGEENDSRTTDINNSNLGEGKDSRTIDISHSNLGEGKDSITIEKYLDIGEREDSKTTKKHCVSLDERIDSKTTEDLQSHLGEAKYSKTAELNFGKGEELRIAETYPKKLLCAGPKPNKFKGLAYALELISKDVCVNVGPRVEELYDRKSKQKLEHGWRVTARCSPLVKSSNDSSVIKLVLSKEDLKNGILQFVRKSKSVSRIYCCDVAQCLTGVMGDLQHVNSVDNDFDSDQIYSPDHAHYSHEIRELAVEETSYFESSIDQDTIGRHIMTSKEQEIIVQGLDSLYLNITPYTYPHNELFGELLRKLILETQFSVVHSRALGLAYRVLTFHPPVNSHMRKYYYRVLKSAIQNEEFGCNQAWKFVHSVIEKLQINAEFQSDGSSSGSGVVDSTIKMKHALRLLQFFVVLFREDMKLHTNWKVVTELLSWHIFWGQSKNPSVLTTPVKQLLKLWVSMQSASPVIRQCLAQLVSIMLELAWRWDNHTLIPVGPLPDSLVAINNELRLHMKDCGAHGSIQLILDLPSPWPRMVICSLIFQELAVIQSPHISLHDILHFGKAVCVSQSTNAASQSKPLDKNSDQSERSSLNKVTTPVKRHISPHIVNKRNIKGETPLIGACIKNNVERVHDLLAVRGIDINLSDNFGWTALHEAAMRGFDECVKILLSHDYDSFGRKSMLYSHLKQDYHCQPVNTSARGGDDKRTPLHDAVESNHLSTVKLLLEAGGDTLLKDKNKYGKTAQDFATTKEMHQLLKSYIGTPPTLALHRGDYSQKYSRTSVITSGRSSPNGILPCLEDQMTFALIYANSYLEVSGTRFLQFAAKKEIYEVHLHHRAKVKHSKTVEAGKLPSLKNFNKDTSGIEFEVEDKDDRLIGNRQTEIEVNGTGKRIISDRAGNMKTSGDTSKRLFGQNLSELKKPNKFEKSLSDRLYEHLRLDIMTCRDQKNGKPLSGDKTEFLDAIQYLFV